MAISESNIESDVVVIGYGAAGATAAITANDSGASVVIVEKMPEGGGSTRVSGGCINLPKDKDYAEYLDILCYKNTGREVIDSFVEESLRTEEWLRAIGGELVPYVTLKAYVPPLAEEEYPLVPGGKHSLKNMIKGVNAEEPPSLRLWRLLSSNVERRGITVLTNTRARELITDKNNEVIGIIAEKDGKSVSVMAKKGVIMTCGGFEYDENMKWDFLPVKPVLAHGNPGNTGDGIRMAQKVGAGLWHMSNLSCSMGFKSPDYEATWFVRFISARYILVDKYGNRFVDEASIEGHEYGRVIGFFDTNRIEYPRIPMYAILDEPCRRKGPLVDTITGFNRDIYKWSADNSDEIRKGWIIRANNIDELAGKISLDKDTLKNTVAKYNEYCEAGADPDFGRPREFLVAIDKPPYYAIKLWPALFNTQGGPQRDKEARVLDSFGKPIPRLYAAGELGSIWGCLYIGGSNLAEAMAFGRIAGRNAVAEDPRF